MKFESKQRYFIHIVHGNEFITMSWYDFIMFDKKKSFHDMNVEIAQKNVGQLPVHRDNASVAGKYFIDIAEIASQADITKDDPQQNDALHKRTFFLSTSVLALSSYFIVLSIVSAH